MKENKISLQLYGMIGSSGDKQMICIHEDYCVCGLFRVRKP